MTIESEHLALVAALSKPGGDILKDLTPAKAHLLHMAVGVAGEAGELLDAIKKHCIYDKELDRENVVEELGDLEFYMAGIRSALYISRQHVLTHNYHKLSKRYGTAYSNRAAQERADKEQQ